jgi:hypothetical protein
MLEPKTLVPESGTIDTLRSILRLRGVESNASDRPAERSYGCELVFGL